MYSGRFELACPCMLSAVWPKNLSWTSLQTKVNTNRSAISHLEYCTCVYAGPSEAVTGAKSAMCVGCGLSPIAPIGHKHRAPLPTDRGQVLKEGSVEEGGNENVQRNAYFAVRNNEKARTHELGRSHRYQRKSTAPNALGSSSVGMPTMDHLSALCLRFGLLPKLGPCPWQVIRCLSS